MLNQHQNRIIVPALSILLLSLLVMPPVAAQVALPANLKSAQFDWACVTDDSLVDAYVPLAAHREEQGLATFVVSLSEVMRWSPAGDGTTAALRWLAGVAHGQWNARYLLLGGLCR